MTELLQPGDAQPIDAEAAIADGAVADAPQAATGMMSYEELAVELGHFGRLIRARASKGRVAFLAMGEYQDMMAEQEFGLDEDTGYIMGGFRSWKQFRTIADSHAMHAARQHVDDAMSKIDFKATLETIGKHPVEDMEHAYHWIKNTTLPLFSERIYRQFGAKPEDFFNALRRQHIDAAKQKIALVKELVKSGDNIALGEKLIGEVLNSHLKRLGISGDDERLELYLNTNMKELFDLHGHFQRVVFRTILQTIQEPKVVRPEGPVITAEDMQAYQASKEALKNHKYPRDSHDYCEAIIEAAKILVNTAGIEDQPETYAGFAFNKHSFNAEFDRCTEILARHHLDIVVNDPNATSKQFEAALKYFEELRPMFTNTVPVPETVDPSFAEDDYWFVHIFKDYKIRSYTKFLDDMHITGARGTIYNAINSEGWSVSAVYDDLDEAEGMLEEARYPTDHPQLLADVNIDYVTFASALIETAPTAANFQWSHTFNVIPQVGDKLNIIGRTIRAASRVEGDSRESKLNFSHERLDAREVALFVRHAEEALADSRICILDSTGAHALMNIGYSDLQDAGATLKNPVVYRKMGMDAATMRGMEQQYDILDLQERWKLTNDKNRSLREQFFDLENVLKLLKTINDPEVVQTLDAQWGQGTVEKLPARLREMGVKLYHEMMGQFDDHMDDAIKAFDIIDVAKYGLETAHKFALANDTVFERVTGIPGNRRQPFLNEHARYKRLSETWSGPMRMKFNKASAGSTLSAALKLTGAKAYYEIMKLARNLRDEGRTLMEPSVLARARTTPRRMRAFIDEQAFAAAAKQLAQAEKQKGQTFTLDTMKDHPYQHCRGMLSWVSRTSYSPLSDKPWRKLGLAGRDAFIDLFRESLVDLTAQMEREIMGYSASQQEFNGITQLFDVKAKEDHDRRPNLPPFQFIATLRTLQDAYHTLGRTAEDQKLGRETVRKALRTMGYEACIDTLATTLSASQKFKMLSGVLTYATAMNARGWTNTDDTEMDNTILLAQKKADVQTLNRAFMGLIQTRVTEAVAHFNARYSPNAPKKAKRGRMIDPLVSQPYVGVSLAVALGDLRKSYKLDQYKWFRDAFEPLGFPDYDSFAHHMAFLRIRQIVNRTQKAIEKIKEDKGDRTTHIAIMRDMETLDYVVDKNLISARERLQIFRTLDIPENWIRENRRSSAAPSLELFARNTKVPTMTAGERFSALDESYQLGMIAGTRVMNQMGIDWQLNERNRARAARHNAALYMMTEVMRGHPHVLSPAIVNTAFTMGMGGNSIGNMSHLRAMGLKPSEAQALVRMRPLIGPYQPLQALLNLRPDIDPVTRHNTLLAYLTEVQGANIDPTTPENLKMLGFSSIEDYKLRVDGPTTVVLAGVREGADQAFRDVNADQARRQLEGLIQIMDISGIEKRHDMAVLERQGVLKREDIMTAYRTVAVPTQRALPAPA